MLEKRLHIIVTANEMQFGSMPEKGTIDAQITWRKLQEESCTKGKKFCFVDLEEDI